MKPEERHAVLLLDEMQLTPGLDYDPTTKTVIGYATMPRSGRAQLTTNSGGAHPSAHSGEALTSAEKTAATHGLVFMLAGVSSRWKQTIAYQFSGEYY